MTFPKSLISALTASALVFNAVIITQNSAVAKSASLPSDHAASAYTVDKLGGIENEINTEDFNTVKTNSRFEATGFEQPLDKAVSNQQKSGLLPVSSDYNSNPVGEVTAEPSNENGSDAGMIGYDASARANYLNLDVQALELSLGETYSFSVSTDADSYRFISYNTDIVEVTDDGLAAPKSVGRTRIECVAQGENGEVSDYCDVTVGDVSQELGLNKTKLILGTGDCFRLESILSDGAASCEVRFSSENTAVATVDPKDGLITAKSMGKANITAKLGSLSAVCALEVLPQAKAVYLNKSKLTLGLGDTFKLSYSTPAGTSAQVKFGSEKENIVSVDENTGVVTALKGGDTYVYCETGEGIRAYCEVYVKTGPQNITLSTSNVLCKVGETFTVSIKDFDGFALGLGSVTWSCSNPSVRITESTFGHASVQAMKVGTCSIVATAFNGVKASCTVSVQGSVVTCIDISTWQGSNVDFNKVKANGIDYVILRAGYGAYSSQIDNQFVNFYNKAKAAGLKVGVYWFSYATSVSGGYLEAAACLECINGRQLDLPIYYDLEYEPTYRAMNMSQYTQLAVNFCDVIQAAGYKAGVYSSGSVWGYKLNDALLRSRDISIWNAEWYYKYSVENDVWQYSENGRVNGISTTVDMNYINNLYIAE